MLCDCGNFLSYFVQKFRDNSDCEIIKLFMLNSNEDETSTAHKN